MSALIHVAGWTLLHFAWQGLLIAFATSAALWFLRHASSHARYIVACAALTAMMVAPVITARALSAPARLEAFSAILQHAPSNEISTPSAIDRSALKAEQREISSRVTVDAVLPLVVALWISGVMFLLARLAGGWWRVRSRHKSALATGASRWQAAGNRIAALLRLRRSVVLVDSADVDTPTVIGWLRPIVLLPIAALANLTPGQVEAILAHELAHIRRHDYLVNLLQSVAETLLFYHPAVWWVSARIRAEREHCCDEVAVETCGDAVGYASALAELETWRTAPATLALAATGGVLLERVRRVLRVPVDDEWPASNALLTALLVLLIVMAGGSKAVYSRDAATALGTQAAQGIPRNDWQRHETPHFDVLYTQRSDVDLESIERQAEAAYERVRSDLGHDLSFRPMLVLYRTQEELERGIGTRDFPQGAEHILLSLEESGRLSSDLAHEITHSFVFDILPRQVTTSLPLWISEGLAEYQRGNWNASNQTALRDLVRRNAIPRMSLLTASSFAENPRLNYGLGHAAFEYIVSRWRDDGVRRLLSSLRQSGAAGDLDSALAAAFGVEPGEFDRGFEEYLKVQFALPKAALKAIPSSVVDRPASVSAEINRLQDLIYDLRLRAARDALRMRATQAALESGPAFEVASIRPNKEEQPTIIRNLPDQFRATGITLRRLLWFAFRVQDFQISGGPSWLDSDRFDVTAKAGITPSSDQLAAMMRALLADHFKLKTHYENGDRPIYALVVATSDGKPNPQLRSTDCGRGASPTGDQPMPCGSVRGGVGRLTAKGVPMSQVVTVLSPVLNRVVVDRTGLNGNFDFDLEWTPDQVPQGVARDPSVAPVDPNGPSIFTALQAQLGLKLEPQRSPIQVLVIDHVERPTEN